MQSSSLIDTAKILNLQGIYKKIVLLKLAKMMLSCFHFLSVTRKKTETKERVQKRPELRGRLSDYRNHSKNSLRSDSFSCRFACFAYATQESKKIPIIVHPINTSSCGMFFERSLMTRFSETNSQSRLPHFVLHAFSNKFSKTFRTKRSLEKFYFFESILSLGLRIAI